MPKLGVLLYRSLRHSAVKLSKEVARGQTATQFPSVVNNEIQVLCQQYPFFSSLDHHVVVNPQKVLTLVRESFDKVKNIKDPKGVANCLSDGFAALRYTNQYCHRLSRVIYCKESESESHGLRVHIESRIHERSRRVAGSSDRRYYELFLQLTNMLPTQEGPIRILRYDILVDDTTALYRHKGEGIRNHHPEGPPVHASLDPSQSITVRTIVPMSSTMGTLRWQYQAVNEKTKEEFTIELPPIGLLAFS